MPMSNPASARATATARPMPDSEPVTTAIRGWLLPIIFMHYPSGRADNRPAARRRKVRGRAQPVGTRSSHACLRTQGSL